MHIRRILSLSSAALTFSLLGLSAQAQTSSGPVTVVGGSGPMFATMQRFAGVTPGNFAVSQGGAATYRIPIQVPPGVAGIEPKLELVYNSQIGNGLIGVGWGLAGLSAIYRCPRTLASDGARDVVNLDLNDHFCLDGNRLILVSGTYGVAGSEYRTELESFSRITALGTAGNGPASFVVKTKAGLTIEYGNTGDSRIEAPGKTTARVWAQNKVSDVKGNYLTVSFTEDNANGDYYPSHIDYTGTASASPTVSVVFGYETRTDVTVIPLPSSSGKNVVRLMKITIVPNGVESRAYWLGYSYGTASARSRLNSVTECSNPIAPQCLSTTLIQTESSVPAVKNIRWLSGNVPANAGWQIADLFGEGRQLFYTHNTSAQHFATRFNSDGTLQNWTWSGGHGIGDGGWQMADPFGDGRQVYYTHSAIGQHFATRFNSDGTLQNWTWSGGQGVGNSGWQMADLFGDGRQVYYTHHANGQHFATKLNSDGTLQNWTWSGGQGVGDAGWQMADLFGDGRKVYYTHSANGQHFATRLNSDGTLQNWTWSGGSGVGNAGWQVLDLFGDGRQVYYTHDTTGQHFATRLNVDGTLQNWTWSGGGVVGDSGWQMADLLGSGRKVFYTPTVVGNHYATEIANAAPDLVVSIGSGMGAITTITEKPLTDSTIYTKDTTGAYPLIDRQVPIYVVSSIASSDGVGGTRVTDYSYGGLKAEQGTGRGMLGFRWTKSKEVATGLENYTEYRQDFPYTGMPVKNETRLAGVGNAGVLKRTTLTPGCQIPQTALACAVAAGNRYFPYVTTRLEESWDINTAAYPSVTSNYAYAQSPQFGDPTLITANTSDGSSKTTTNEYWPADTVNWIPGLLKKATVTSVVP